VFAVSSDCHILHALATYCKHRQLKCHFLQLTCALGDLESLTHHLQCTCVQTLARNASTDGNGDGGRCAGEPAAGDWPRPEGGFTLCQAGAPPKPPHRSSRQPGGTLQMSDCMKVSFWEAAVGARRPVS